MKIYHGSDHIITKPDPEGGRLHNDYGRGFYCTQYPDMAREWASSADRGGYLNEYSMDTDGLKVLNLNEYPILVWLAVLLENRVFELDSPLSREAYSYLTDKFHVDYKEYDLIMGYRADDSYFAFARDFLKNTISLRQLSEAMQLGGLGNQIVLKSTKAFERIEYTCYEEVDSKIWYPRRIKRDEEARSKYHSTDKGYIRGETYIIHILEEEMTIDDERIQLFVSSGCSKKHGGNA